MFLLQSNITIGQYKRVKPHEVKTNKSIHSFVDKCSIKIPITARIKQAGEVVTQSADTAKLFTEGDKVNVQLAYNGILRKEFEGFVSRVNFTTPVEIECEGYSYQLRKNSYVKTFKNTTLKEILEFLIVDTDIILSDNIPNLKVDKWIMSQHNGTEVLEKLKKELLVSIQFTDNVLYAGLTYLNRKKNVKYKLGWNVIKDGNLKLRQAKNQEVIVKFIGEKKDGTKVLVTKGTHTRKVDHKIKTTGIAGTTGETLLLKSHIVTDKATLQAMANKKHSDLSYDGYEGKLTCFLQPFCEPGYTAIVEDKKYPERSGKYIVESTEVRYGMSGARRIVEIGHKL